VLDVERWAELRREHFVRGVGIKQLARRYGVDRNTVRRAIRSNEPPRYQRPAVTSKLEQLSSSNGCTRRDPEPPPASSGPQSRGLEGRSDETARTRARGDNRLAGLVAPPRR